MNFKTSCHDCTFIVPGGVDEDGEYTKPECEIGMLDEYKELGYVVTELQVNNDIFPIINDRIGCRLHTPVSNDDGLLGTEMLETLARQNSGLKIGLVVYLEPENYNLDIPHILEKIELAMDRFRFEHVYLIDSFNRNIVIFNFLNRQKRNFPFTVCSTFENSKNESIHWCSKYFNEELIYVINKDIDVDFVLELEKEINNDLKEYVLAYDKFGGWITYKKLYELMFGELEETYTFPESDREAVTVNSYTAKLEFYCEEHGKQHLIRRGNA